jgi:predicted TIM-barrel fold metal-dependent hydrolase
MMKKVTSEKIIYGTDFPWFSQPYCIGTVLGADITDEDRRNILYRNAMRILGE